MNVYRAIWTFKIEDLYPRKYFIVKITIKHSHDRLEPPVTFQGEGNARKVKMRKPEKAEF